MYRRIKWCFCDKLRRFTVSHSHFSVKRVWPKAALWLRVHLKNALSSRCECVSTIVINTRHTCRVANRGKLARAAHAVRSFLLHAEVQDIYIFI